MALALCALQDGNTPLLQVCVKGDVAAAQWFVAYAGSNPRTELNTVRCCCVQICCAFRNRLIVAMFCVQKSDSALMLAVKGGHLDVVTWLVGTGYSDAVYERDGVR